MTMQTPTGDIPCPNCGNYHWFSPCPRFPTTHQQPWPFIPMQGEPKTRRERIATKLMAEGFNFGDAAQCVAAADRLIAELDRPAPTGNASRE